VHRFPQEVKREEVRVAGVRGGDQWTRLSSEAGSSSYHAVDTCKVGGTAGGPGLVVWEGAEGLSWAGLPLGWVAAVSWGAVSDELEGPCARLGARVGATMCCCWGGSWEQLSLLHAPSSAPLRGFPGLRGACARLCRCRVTLVGCPGGPGVRAGP